METNASNRISKVEITEDTLTGRGGMAFFVTYLESIGIISLLLSKFASLRKSRKGLPLRELFIQVLCFFFDGTSRHVSYFDDLQKDGGYAAAIQQPTEQMASSHVIKRFMKAFGVWTGDAFRWILGQLFLWRLKMIKPRVIVATIDTMVMDNDEALKREGCDPTYKKVKGFQPLQMIWEGKIVDAVFRRGKKHSNYGNDVERMIKRMTKLIREKYDATVTIIFRLDSGFMDEKIFALCDELGLGFIGTGKMYEKVKGEVSAIAKEQWKSYDNGRQKWSYAGFEYKCEKWARGYRALYTRPEYEEEQGLLDFARPDNIIITNLQEGERVVKNMSGEEKEHWLKEATIIQSHHQRGADELPHRGLKQFGSEELPFQRFAPNRAYYYLMLVSFFVFECFKEDNLDAILPIGSYAETVRRKLIDIAAKIVRTAGAVILKVSKAVMERLQLNVLMERCRAARRIIPI